MSKRGDDALPHRRIAASPRRSACRSGRGRGPGSGCATRPECRSWERFPAPMMQSPSQCHDLARRLADLEPDLSDGAARIRAEIEGRRDLAEVREQDRVRTELRDAVTRVAESLEIDGLDATPLDTAVEALTTPWQRALARWRRTPTNARPRSRRCRRWDRRSGTGSASSGRSIARTHPSWVSPKGSLNLTAVDRWCVGSGPTSSRRGPTSCDECSRPRSTGSGRTSSSDGSPKNHSSPPSACPMPAAASSRALKRSIATERRAAGPRQCSAPETSTAAITLFLALNLPVKPRLPAIVRAGRSSRFR